MTAGSGMERNLSGRTILITGANAGIGYWCTEMLAACDTRVMLGCRSAERAQTAVDSIRDRTPAADLRVIPLDLGSLAGIADAGGAIDERIDVVICNAGVKAADRAARTADGLDLMMGTNFLGHFALIAQLEHSLADDARVVAVGSLAHRFADVTPSAISEPWSGSSLRQYGRSKAALMAFAFELDRRWSTSARSSIVAHPGYAVDPLSPPRPRIQSTPSPVRMLAAPSSLLVQGKDAGAAPIVHAATAPGATSGDYWGPDGFLELRGRPKRVKASATVTSARLGAALWSAAESITGVSFPS